MSASMFASICRQCGTTMIVPAHYHRKVIQCSSCGRDLYALAQDESRQDDSSGAETSLLKSVGFWSPRGSDPTRLVAPDFYGAELPLIVRYLQTAQCVVTCLGYSYCRFRCGIPDHDMGVSDFSDGVWAWPEGLSHYVEQHAVRLPEEFVATMRENRWHPPEVSISLPSEGRIYDSSFWHSWSAQQMNSAP